MVTCQLLGHTCWKVHGVGFVVVQLLAGSLLGFSYLLTFYYMVGGNPHDKFWARSGRVTCGLVLLYRKCMVFYIASEKNLSGLFNHSD